MIKDLYLTRVIISQDILLALSICDRIALLDEGKIIKVALPAEIAADEETLAKTGLDYHPYVDLIKRYIKGL
jgi:ABC-type glutathione transport system ATPase component